MHFYFKDENNNLYAYDETQTPKEGLIPISAEERDAIEISEREKAFNALSYEEKRRSSYPPISDYLDGIVKGDQSQIDDYIAKCLAVKAKYPKPQ